MADTVSWEDCPKWLPYKDYLRKWQLIPLHTQRRTVFNKFGILETQYRERQPTGDEMADRAW